MLETRERRQAEQRVPERTFERWLTLTSRITAARRTLQPRWRRIRFARFRLVFACCPGNIGKDVIDSVYYCKSKVDWIDRKFSVPQTEVDRLRWFRDEHLEGDQKALAEALGCSESYVSLLMNGVRTHPSRKLLVNFVKSLRSRYGVTMEWLETGDGPAPALLLQEDFSSNTPRSAESKRAAEQMHKAQVLEYREALLWVFSRLSDEQLEKLYGEVRRDEGLSHAQQIVVTDGLLVEERKRKRRAVPKN